MKVWVSYLYSVIRSEQLSYTKYFDPGNLYQYRKLSPDGPEGGVDVRCARGCGRRTGSVFVIVIFF